MGLSRCIVDRVVLTSYQRWVSSKGRDAVSLSSNKYARSTVSNSIGCPTAHKHIPGIPAYGVASTPHDNIVSAVPVLDSIASTPHDQTVCIVTAVYDPIVAAASDKVVTSVVC
jgi:hypothetical protein